MANNLNSIEWNGTSYNVGGVTSVNGKTGAVTISVPSTPIYEHFVSISGAYGTSGGGSALQLYYKFISTDSPETVARDPMAHFWSTCTSEDVLVSGVFVGSSGGTGRQMLVTSAKSGSSRTNLTLQGFEVGSGTSSVTITDRNLLYTIKGEWISSVQVGVK